MSLQDKIAIVTGGARGIGAGIVRFLCQEGAKVAFTYVSSSSRTPATELVASLTESGYTAISIQADVADLSSPDKIISETLSAFGTDHVDILVNNAGVSGNQPLEDITVEQYTRLMDVNVRGVIFMTKAVVEVFPTASSSSSSSTGKERKDGRIVNLSSISARGGFATQSVYAASKAAVEGLTRVWATELGLKYAGGITVNAVNPGPVDTEMYRDSGEVHSKRMEEENSKVPAGQRCGTVEDIADIVAWLCSEKARWVTGDVVCANGGMMYL